MFSGIIESTSVAKKVVAKASGLSLTMARPVDFLDLKIGDSVAIDGVCLTVESLSDDSMQFMVGPETLRVTEWTEFDLQNHVFNLERSLRLGDRLHGHLVSGHVDSKAVVIHRKEVGESLELHFSLSESVRTWVWPKGSIAVNGVSLTINEVYQDSFQVCLIPETLKRTNLQKLSVGDFVNIEGDWMAKSFGHIMKNSLKSKEVTP